MGTKIEAVLFDMGGTLRTTNMRKRDVDKEKIHEMIVLLGMDIDDAGLIELLQEHARSYRDWAKKTLLELNEVELWTRWMLPEWTSELVSQHAYQLNRLWRDATVKHVIFPETKDVICTLFRRGYRLGVVSNTTSSDEVPRILQELGIAGFFETVVLSCLVGIRKPDPSILLTAAKRMGVCPEHCAYIGDQPRRDVAAARKAGFSKAIILCTQRPLKSEQDDDSTLLPDHEISNLNDLLNIFPQRSPPQPATTYDVSLSTMWAIKNFPTLTDFFEAARRMGFARIELNHKVTTPMLDGIDPTQYHFSSVHEPCPADIGEDDLKKRDWLISSTDESNRFEGIKAIKRSIEKAKEVGASTVVIHAGQTLPDHDRLEKKLRELLDAGQRDSDEYRAIHARMIKIRAEHEKASFAAVKRSIRELLDVALPLHICLGLENRYHYLEHPSPDELEILLSLAGPDNVGFIFDAGHAETLDRLGFYPKNEWLERFTTRIIGTHLHDVVTTVDHYAAGLGDADFKAMAAYLPENAFRTCEFQNFNSPEQVKAALEFLVEHKCINYSK
jgi:putative hydrolase of the HAD superfamily